MQQLNVLPVSISQGSDLKDESRFSSSGRSASNDSFSLLIEQHVTDKSQLKTGTKNVDRIDGYKEKNSTRATPVTKDKVADENNLRAANVENDLATSGNSESSEIASEAKEDQSILSDSADSSEEVRLDDKSEHKNDIAKNSDSVIALTDALTKSQKFISLLHASEKTLISEKDNVTLNNATPDNVITEEVNSEQEVVLLKEKGVTTNSGQGSNQKIAISSDKIIQNVNVDAKVNPETVNDAKAMKVSEEALTNVGIDKQLMTSKTLDSLAKPELMDKKSKEALEQSSTSLFSKTNETKNNADINNDSSIDDHEVGTKTLNEEHSKSVLNGTEKPTSSSLTSSVSSASSVVELKTNASVKRISELQQRMVNDVENNKKPALELTNKLNTEIDVESVKFDVNKALTSEIKKPQLDNKLNDEELSRQQTGQLSKQSEFDKIAQQNKPAEQQISHQMKRMLQEEKALEAEFNDVQIDESELATKKVNFTNNEVDLKVKTSSIILDVNRVDANSNTRLYSDSITNATQINDRYVEQPSSELLSYNVASDTAQIQKNNVLLQQETISIFRKDFAEVLKDKVMLVISQKLQQFDISLDPPELGNVQVRVNMQGEQAVVNFIVQNQQAKEALEQNMHKLRDMLSEQGVDVGDANVEQQAHQSSGEETDSNNSSQNTFMNENELIPSQTLLSAQTLSNSVTNNATNVVDYYA